MTQTDFDSLPLLLHRAQVMDVVPGVCKWAIYDYRMDGELRTFQPDPDSSFAYYFKADVARIHGHLAITIHWEAMPEWLRTGEFCEVTGLAKGALERACETGMLAAVRHGEGNRRFYREDLRWFL